LRGRGRARIVYYDSMPWGSSWRSTTTGKSWGDVDGVIPAVVLYEEYDVIPVVVVQKTIQ
jgi:hypothetical protein